MPKKIYYLDSNNQKEAISISWKGVWKNILLTHNEIEIGTFKNQTELKKGKEFQLDEVRKLSVKMKKGMFPTLELLMNGEPVVGSPTDPKIQLKELTRFVFAIGTLNLIIGLLAELLDNDFLLNLGLGIFSMIYGVVIIALGFGVKKKSIVALGIIITLLILDIMASFWFALENSSNPTNGIVIKIFFIIFLVKGFRILKKIKAKK